MATTILNEAKKAISGIDQSQPATPTHNTQSEVEFAKCECCGLTEECTHAYIARVRQRYQGQWICGLCAEAVKDEKLRSEMDIGADEALRRHMKFCQKFRSSSPPTNPTEDLISAMKQLLKRTLDSPRKQKSVFQSDSSLARSKSCFSSLSK